MWMVKSSFSMTCLCFISATQKMNTMWLSLFQCLNLYCPTIMYQWYLTAGCMQTQVPISFKHLIPPEKFPPPPPLLDLQALPLSALHIKEFEFISTPTGSSKTICAEFALLHLWSKCDQTCAVCIEPYQEMVDQWVAEWHCKFSKVQGCKEIVSLTGESSANLRLLEKGNMIVCTPTQVKPLHKSSQIPFNSLSLWPVGCTLKTLVAMEKCTEHRPTHCWWDPASGGWSKADVQSHLQDTLCFRSNQKQDMHCGLWHPISKCSRSGWMDGSMLPQHL